MSIRKDLYDYIKENGKKKYPRNEFQNLIQKTSWPRALRQLQQDGVISYEWEKSDKSYIITEINEYTTKTTRSSLSNKDLYRIRQRDNHCCQACGKGVKDGVNLHVDHRIPVDMGGSNKDENLWVLCEKCNQGKKNFFKDDLDTEIMELVFRESSGYQRLKVLFKNTPDKVFTPSILKGISKIRDWTRTIRLIRDKEGMNIKYVSESKEYPEGGYVYMK